MEITGEGYRAIELGGFEQWHSNRKEVQLNEPSIKVDNISIVAGDRNNVNQSNLENSSKVISKQIIKQEEKTKTSLIEIVSWIVGKE